MNFAELKFWALLAGALAVALVIRPVARKFRIPPAGFDRVALLLIGLTLLFAVSAPTFFIFLAVAVGTYVGLKLILYSHGRAPRRYLVILIPLQLLPLFFYKYANFLCNDVLSLQIDALRDVIIPVGISFYTFQKVAFVLDTLAFKQPMPRFLDYMNFAGFFPQIVAGPIERRANLLPQMENFRFRWDPQAIDNGAAWIALGLFFKCCLADNLAEFFRPENTTNAYVIWINNVLFGLRIYYDFAGYSLIALGLARCLGVRLTLNFESPYTATSSTEFWRRWHITLSQWFRDYVYIPMGGGRVPWWATNILLVFLLSGVWHGAGWNFLLWGALHGLLLIAHRLAAPKMSLPSSAGWLLTIVPTFFAWLCFYETNWARLVAKLRTLFIPDGYGSSALSGAMAPWTGPERFVMLCFLALTAGTLLLEWQSLRRGREPYALLRHRVTLAAVIILTVVLAPGKNNGFIYFAF
jgi:alginate O-acetyltransferase complex protein AlgI